MLALELLAERKISEAVSRGELDNLPGAGQPLDLQDDPLVPEELRVAYRLLKNAGFVPTELEARREIASLERVVLADDVDARTRAKAVKKLALLRTRIENDYYEKALRKLGG
jgi:hypothetical protein